MNVYDFDDTIYKGDSGVDIIKFGLKKHPVLVFTTLFKTCFVFAAYIFKKKEIVDIKESALSFIFKIKNKNKFIQEFIDKHISNIKPWYYEKKEENDLIISASPNNRLERPLIQPIILGKSSASIVTSSCDRMRCNVGDILSSPIVNTNTL